ncbi:hypothetical protein BS50DRAFT_634157 [Corynespora cassiicola Philippines]|uniref:Uncharacterized protein n=1 Tax=Corynespora cassiicola Philippines TaxID=1448308 RepID=A0A2T2NMJ9_CORCC|nr:hypothetical protein BS50DRAFT_634157 [Corynespora cassiicola Philippines]
MIKSSLLQLPSPLLVLQEFGQAAADILKRPSTIAANMATTRPPAQPITIVPEDMDDEEEQDILNVIVPYIQPSSTVSSAEAAQSFDALLLARRARHSTSTSTKTKEYVTSTYIWYIW